MSDALLEVLVEVCAVLPSGQKVTAESRLRPQRVRLTDFLNTLYQRYGVLIDRPPVEVRNTETISAAKENFAAFKRLLRQMGLFSDLSDDFNAQYICPRYRDSRPRRAGEPATAKQEASA